MSLQKLLTGEVGGYAVGESTVVYDLDSYQNLEIPTWSNISSVHE